ncbi:hypothetical protein CVT26_012836 [Gymnopilus dilepis]|uniref:BTB domain-containing protein n=1 Tax=Gymnopilus dilepis TaxID=231916 RepID=A0A409Y464_9AGAR|nr:hypothetical protein CVT26_012836 [Gymnopilus dilepis]
MDIDMDDFSTNRHAESDPLLTSGIPDLTDSPPIRHSDMWFSDGNIVLVAGDVYFRVHQGLLCRHSAPLREAVGALEAQAGREEQTERYLIEGQRVLVLDDQPKDLCHFLLALYDGISHVKHDNQDFDIVSALLRLSTKYRVEHIRNDVLRGMSMVWPRNLSAWEFREADATDSTGVYKPRSIYPHPILVINLAKETSSPYLLPSAFYDLSRCAASEIATGYLPPGSTDRSALVTLSDEDLMNVLRGREHASRFLSTFVVNELEGREPSVNCLHRNSGAGAHGDGGAGGELDTVRKRICQATFEATTFEILRDVNGVVLHRSSDPLFAIMDADLMQTRGPDPSAVSILGGGGALGAFAAGAAGGVAGVAGGPGGVAGGAGGGGMGPGGGVGAGGAAGQGAVAMGRLGLLHRACEPCRMEFTAAVDAAREELWHKLPYWFGVCLDSWP